MVPRQTDSSLSQRLIRWAYIFWYEEESDSARPVEIHDAKMPQHSLPQRSLPESALTAAFG
jgi:hypothetical protein